MAILPPPAGKFRPELLFQPRSVAIIGAASPIGAQVLANLATAGFNGQVMPVEDVAALTAPPDIAAICALSSPIAAVFRQLAELGTRSAIVLCMADGVAEAARAAGIRALGPGSFGIAVP